MVLSQERRFNPIRDLEKDALGLGEPAGGARERRPLLGGK